jgi:CxxC motif-containing protein (DUF1111 family)
MRSVNKLSLGASAFALTLSLLAAPAFAQVDPGIRGGLQNTAGFIEFSHKPIPEPPLLSPNPITGIPVNPNEQASFVEGINRAGQLESTCDRCSPDPDGSPVEGLGELDPFFPQSHTNSNGLGARHNADQCFVCHAQPTLGGSGGFLVPNPTAAVFRQPENPEFDLIPHRFGKANIVPDFENQFGPIREVRFKFNPDGTRDGSVHQLWTLKGLTTDATILGCAITQPDFAGQERAGNLSFRIPLQLFGLGLIESIQDQELVSSFNSTAKQRAALGIAGHPNRSANDATITRFGWKAQNKSITIFAGEAYNVEMGVTNEVFPTATEENDACQGNDKPEPNDVVRTEPSSPAPDGVVNQNFFNPINILPDWMQFQLLMRFMDPPQPEANPSTSAIHGASVFQEIGCAACHTPQMVTAPTMNSPVLQARPVNLFSDVMVHHMGGQLADNIVQGAAGPDEFRTTPLWGVGQRMFFLHDGRAADLLTAIEDHFGTADRLNGFPPSEANTVVEVFNHLSVSDKQSVLDFLRSL